MFHTYGKRNNLPSLFNLQTQKTNLKIILYRLEIILRNKQDEGRCYKQFENTCKRIKML